MIIYNSMADYGHKLKYGAFWITLNRFVVLGVQFFAMIILARILTPSDFAIMGIISFFINISQTIVDSGMGGALVKKKIVTDTDYATFFVFNILTEFLLYLLFCFCSGFLASFYDILDLEKYNRLASNAKLLKQNCSTLTICILIEEWLKGRAL